MADFKESEHPRNRGGEFVKKQGDDAGGAAGVDSFLFVGGSSEVLHRNERHSFSDFSRGDCTVTLQDGSEVDLAADVHGEYSVGPIVDELADGTLEARWKTIDTDADDPFTGEDGSSIEKVDTNYGTESLAFSMTALERQGYDRSQIFVANFDRNTVIAGPEYDPRYNLDSVLRERHPDREFSANDVAMALDIDEDDAAALFDGDAEPPESEHYDYLQQHFGVRDEQIAKLRANQEITDSLPPQVELVGVGAPGETARHPEWEPRKYMESSMSTRAQWADGDVWSMHRQRFSRGGEPLGDTDDVYGFIGDSYSDETMKTGDF